MNIIFDALKPLDPFGTETKIKVHRFTNNLQGLQKVMVKDFSWNISPWNALLFEKSVKQYKFSLARITDLFWTHVMTRRNARKQEWVFPLFYPDSDDRLSLNFHRFVVLYISCDTRSVGLGQYCLLKVYNGFNKSGCKPFCSYNKLKYNSRLHKQYCCWLAHTQLSMYN